MQYESITFWLVKPAGSNTKIRGILQREIGDSQIWTTRAQFREKQTIDHPHCTWTSNLDHYRFVSTYNWTFR